MTFRIPSQGRISQTNESDVTGNIYSTRNIDFDEAGYIKLSDGTLGLYSVDDDADFRNLQSMFHGSSLYIVGSDLFKVSSFDVNFSITNVTATDTTPPSPGPEEDGVYFNDTEVVSDGTAVKYNVSGTWTTIASTTAPATGEPSAMEIFPAQNSLLFGTGNTVQRINTSWAIAQTLTLPSDYMVTSITVNGNYAYIGTRHQESGEAILFLWTGANTTNDGSYGVGTFEISTIKKYGSTVALVNTLGQLLQFTGSGFSELGSLPVYYSNAHWADASNEYDAISNRGMVVDGDLIFITINPEVELVNQRYLQNMQGGVWCYDPKVGLYHRYTPTNNTIVKDIGVDAGDINTTTDTMTVSGIVVPVTGSPVYYKDAGTSIGGLVDGKWYYTIYVSDTTFQVAETKEDADNGTQIDLTSTSASNDFMFVSQKDFGVSLSGNKSSILTLNNTEYNTLQLGRFVFSSDHANTTSTKKETINITCPVVPNRGHFITPKMFAENDRDNFNSIALRFKPLKYDDKIIVKYRDCERLGLPAVPRGQNTAENEITWTSSTVFTTPASPTGNYYDLSTVIEDDEVEVISGSGAGWSAAVSTITKSGFQYTVTLKEANPFVSASDNSVIMVNNWKEVQTIDYTNTTNEAVVAVDTASAWVQFKIEMEGTQVAIYDSVINNKAYGRAK